MKYLLTTLISLYIGLVQASVITDKEAPNFALMDSFGKTVFANINTIKSLICDASKSQVQ